MKKEKREVKKLNLSRETLHQLHDAQLSELVHGGCTTQIGGCETSIGEGCCVHK